MVETNWKIWNFFVGGSQFSLLPTSCGTIKFQFNVVFSPYQNFNLSNHGNKMKKVRLKVPSEIIYSFRVEKINTGKLETASIMKSTVTGDSLHVFSSSIPMCYQIGLQNFLPSKWKITKLF